MGFYKMNKIGSIKTYTSDQICRSRISVGFECLDRDMFKPEKCYDAMFEAGIKCSCTVRKQATENKR